MSTDPSKVYASGLLADLEKQGVPMCDVCGQHRTQWHVCMGPPPERVLPAHVIEGTVKYEGIPMESTDCSVGGTDIGALLLAYESKRVRVTVEVLDD